MTEKTAADAPCHLNADEASAWASGWDAGFEAGQIHAADTHRKSLRFGKPPRMERPTAWAPPGWHDCDR